MFTSQTTSLTASDLAGTCASIRSQVPLRCHRYRRFAQVCHRPVSLRQIPSWRPRAQLPQDASDDRAMIAPRFLRQPSLSNQLATLSPGASSTSVGQLIRFVRPILDERANSGQRKET